jgi:UPF0755 protein
VRRFLLLIIVVVAAVCGAGAWWLHQPLALSAALGPAAEVESVEVVVGPGMASRAVAQAIADAGVKVNPGLLYGWFRLSGEARKIKAGTYEFARNTTPRGLLAQLVQGEEAMLSITLVEGWTFSQLRDALAKAEQLKPTTAGLDPAEIMNNLGRAGVHPEGRFFPDTYNYAKGTSARPIRR